MTAPAYLLRGQVMHERLRPVLHRFVYPVFFVRLNLARLEEAGNFWFGINRAGLMSLRTRDYGPRDGSDLQVWMRAQLTAAGLPADGEIWLQTFPRLFGFVFNPVSFWYCHDSSGALCAVLAEVNNTFGETQRYLLADAEGREITEHTRLVCAKTMHVSPFCEVRGSYQFRFRDSEASAMVGIDYDDGNGALINTAIGGRRQPLTGASALRALLAQPGMSIGIVVKIHWQAWKLWRKHVPFFRKPDRSPDRAAIASTSTSSSSANFKKETSS